MSDTPHRYTAALAEQIEVAWQDRWAERGTFHAPNPSGPWADPEAVAADPGGHLLVLDMFPYPSGAGPARRPPARLHRHRRLRPLPADARPQRAAQPGLRRVRPAGRAVRGADRPAPARDHRGQHRQHGAPAAPPRPGPRRPPRGPDHRPRVLPLDPVDLPADLQLLVRRRAVRPDGGLGRARPIAELVEEYGAGTRPLPADDGRAWADLSDVERAGILDGHRLAYIGEAPVNWCPGLGTVLANEEVTADGRSERGNFPVFRRNLQQWMMRITAYADRLVDDLDRLDWPESVKIMQRNWIGRSPTGRRQVDASRSGAQASDRSTSGIEVVHHPARHPVRRHLHGAGPRAPAASTSWCRPAAGPRAPRTPGPAAPPPRRRPSRPTAARHRRKTDLERQTEGKDKTGVFTGACATNPVNGTRIPIFVADYVLMGYGTGAIMAVPGQDQRDWEFAEAFDLPIVRTVQPTDGHDRDTAFTGEGPAINSANAELSLDGLGVAEAKARIIDWLAGQGPGRAHGHLQAARLAVLPAALLGRAVPDRLRRGRRRPRRARRDAAGRAARDGRLQPEDLRRRRREQRARAAAGARRRVGARRARPRRRPRHAPLPPRDQHDAAVGRLVLVLPALPRPDQQRRVRRPRGRAYWMGPRAEPVAGAAGTRPGRRRPVRRRRRARRAAPALRPLLAQGAVRPRPREQRRAVPRLLQPGLHPGRRVHGRPRPVRRGRGGRRGRRRQPSPGRASRSPASSARWASR